MSSVSCVEVTKENLFTEHRTRDMNPRKRKNSVPKDAETSGIKKNRSTKNPPKNDGGTKIEDVCSDCLEKIFGYLDLDDLAVAGQVSNLFNQIAVNIFFRKFTQERHFSIAESSHRGSKNVKLEKMENFLKCFGKELFSLEASTIDGRVSGKPNDERILDFITKYFCSNDNDNVTGDAEELGVKKLQLKEFNFTDSMIANINILFGRISKLTLVKCKLLDGTDQLFANCGNLTKLKLDFVHTNPAVEFEYRGGKRKFNKIRTNDALDPCFNHHFPKLISFTMRSIGTATGTDIDNFLSKNPQLRKLKIIECRGLDDVVQSVVRNVPSIEKFSIQANYIKSKKDLLPLKQLKKLEVNFNRGIYKNAIIALGAVGRSDIVLERLKLVDFLATDELMKSLVKYETLTQLELIVGYFSDANLQTLSENLSETQITVTQATDQ